MSDAERLGGSSRDDLESALDRLISSPYVADLDRVRRRVTGGPSAADAVVMSGALRLWLDEARGLLEALRPLGNEESRHLERRVALLSRQTREVSSALVMLGEWMPEHGQADQ